MKNIDEVASTVYSQCGYNFRLYETELAKYENQLQEIPFFDSDKTEYFEKGKREKKQKRHVTFLYSLILLKYFTDYDLIYYSCTIALNINFPQYVIKNLLELQSHFDLESDMYLNILSVLAKAYRNLNQFDKSLACYKEAHNYYSKRKDELNKNWMTYSIGKLYLNYLQQPSRSIDILLEAKSNFEKLDTNEKHRGISACIDELGDVYRQGLKDYHKAITIYDEAVKYNTHPDRLYPAGLSRNYSHIGLCYWQLGDLERAEDFLIKAIEIIQTIPGQEKGLGIRLTQLGKVQIDKGLSESGYKSLLRGQELNERYVNTEYEIFNLIYQGDYYYYLKQINNALGIYLNAIEKSRGTLFYDLTSMSFNKASHCYFNLNLFNESRQALIQSINNNIKYWGNMKNGVPQSKISSSPELGEMYQSLFYKLGDVYASDLNNTVASLDRVYDALILEYEHHKKNYESVLRFGSIMTGIKHEIQNLHNDIVAVISDITEERTLTSENLNLLNDLKTKIFEKSNILSHNNLKEIILNINDPIKLTKEVIEEIFSKVVSDFRISNISFEFFIADINCRIAIDEISFKYILLNIFLNSKESFEISNLATHKVIKISVFMQGDKLIISIKDNGGGIPNELINRVFDFGFSTKPGSTGYGLSTIRTLITSSNGDIILKNNEANGVEVIINFLLI